MNKYLALAGIVLLLIIFGEIGSKMSELRKDQNQISIRVDRIEQKLDAIVSKIEGQNR